MDISARSGPAAIVASGEITAFEGHPLELTIWPNPENPFLLRWEFESDPEVEDVAVHFEHRADGFHFRCTNFDTADGRGTGKPLRLMEIGRQRFWLHFRVFLYGKTSDRTLHYSLYVEDF